MDDIKLALVQICPVPGRIPENTENTAAFLFKAAEEGARLAVFPECSLTGYATEKASELAIAYENSCIKDIERICDELGIAACFGYMEKRGEKLYIAQELYSGGTRTVYRKTHLGTKEALHFSQGDSFPAADVSGIRCGMQLCWESHIPQISAKYRKSGCQLLLFPYASPMGGETARENWSVHLPARASDNGVFAAACNLLFEGGRGGGIAAWDPKGKLTAQYFGKEEKVIFCDIGGELPGERFLEIQKGLAKPDMHFISYFDKARSELF